MTGCAILRLEFPPSAAEEDAFLLRIDAAQPQEIAERRCAAEACFAEKSTSLKARRARDFKSKGILLHTFALVYLILLYTTQQQAKTKKKRRIWRTLVHGHQGGCWRLLGIELHAQPHYVAAAGFHNKVSTVTESP